MTYKICLWARIYSIVRYKVRKRNERSLSKLTRFVNNCGSHFCLRMWPKAVNFNHARLLSGYRSIPIVSFPFFRFFLAVAKYSRTSINGHASIHNGHLSYNNGLYILSRRTVPTLNLIWTSLQPGAPNNGFLNTLKLFLGYQGKLLLQLKGKS